MRRVALRRLLVLLPSRRMGGAERHTVALAARLGAAGLAVTLAAEPALLPELAAAAPAGLPAPAFRPAAIGWEEATPKASAAAQEAALAPLLAEAAPDLALLALPWPNAGLGLMAGLAAARLPRLVLFHLAPEATPPGIPVLRARLGLEGTAFAAVSPATARRAEQCFGLPQGVAAVLANPAPPPARLDRALTRAALRQTLGLRPDAPLVLFVGRLEKAKGADLLPEISRRLPGTLACCGEGPLLAELSAEAAADPRRLLRLLGQVADPAPWYVAADALVMPSRLEGAPLVFLEAAANHCPIVATAAALEVHGAAAAALAWPVAEAEPAALAGAVAALLADPATTARRVAAAAALATRQDWPATTRAALGLLRAAALRQPMEHAA
jgi:glycosyltransferase involved in cell wall biosynthesis